MSERDLEKMIYLRKRINHWTKIFLKEQSEAADMVLQANLNRYKVLKSKYFKVVGGKDYEESSD